MLKLIGGTTREMLETGNQKYYEEMNDDASGSILQLPLWMLVCN